MKNEDHTKKFDCSWHSRHQRFEQAMPRFMGHSLAVLGGTRQAACGWMSYWYVGWGRRDVCRRWDLSWLVNFLWYPNGVASPHWQYEGGSKSAAWESKRAGKIKVYKKALTQPNITAPSWSFLQTIINRDELVMLWWPENKRRQHGGGDDWWTTCNQCQGHWY